MGIVTVLWEKIVISEDTGSENRMPASQDLVSEDRIDEE